MRKLIATVLLSFVLISCAHQQTGRIDHDNSHSRNRDLSMMLGKMLSRNGYPVSAVKYCIWDNPDQVNAYMGTEGVMVFTTGLLNQVPAGMESVIECVMAHELAHYTLRHPQSRETVNKVTGFAGLAGLFAVSLVTGVNVLDANNLITPTITSAYSRSQELDADAEAVRILTNYGVQGAAASYTNTLRWLEARSPGRGFALWASHPSWDDRISYVLTQQR